MSDLSVLIEKTCDEMGWVEEPVRTQSEVEEESNKWDFVTTTSNAVRTPPVVVVSLIS